MELQEIVQQCIKDSRDWFGEDLANNIPHHCLALAGEVGELCNLIKKLQRKSLDINDETVQNDIAMEITDCFIYLCNLAALMGMDLGKAYDTKRFFNVERFSDAPVAGDGGTTPE